MFSAPTCSSSEGGMKAMGCKGFSRRMEENCRNPSGVLALGTYRANISSRPYRCSANLYLPGVKATLGAVEGGDVGGALPSNRLCNLKERGKEINSCYNENKISLFYNRAQNTRR